MNKYNVIDLHCDTIPRLYTAMQEGKHQHLFENEGQISLEFLEQGGYMCQCFSLFTYLKELEEKGIRPFDHVRALAAFWQEEIGRYQDRIKQVRSYQDILDNASFGRISAIMTVEEGAVYEGKIENLHHMYDLGVRISTVTWNFINELGYPNPAKVPGKPYLPDVENGLTPTGFEFMEEMERLGILIDVSHLNDAGIHDVFTCTRGPVIATHSNARSCHYHLRNLTDENIRKIAERGGIIGINFFPDFLKDQPENENWARHIASTDDLIRHMEYIRNLGGIDCISLGTDFDGFDGVVTGIRNASQMQHLADAMEKHHFTDDEIEKVFSGNALRVFREVW